MHKSICEESYPIAFICIFGHSTAFDSTVNIDLVYLHNFKHHSIIMERALVQFLDELIGELLFNVICENFDSSKLPSEIQAQIFAFVGISDFLRPYIELKIGHLNERKLRSLERHLADKIGFSTVCCPIGHHSHVTKEGRARERVVNTILSILHIDTEMIRNIDDYVKFMDELSSGRDNLFTLQDQSRQMDSFFYDCRHIASGISLKRSFPQLVPMMDENYDFSKPHFDRKVAQYRKFVETIKKSTLSDASSCKLPLLFSEIDEVRGRCRETELSKLFSGILIEISIVSTSLTGKRQR